MKSSRVPYRVSMPAHRVSKVSRVVSGARFAGLGATSIAPPVGAGSGAGAEIGASQGASVGSAIVPGIGTAIGAIVGAIAGAIAGAINKTDPENANFNQAVAIYAQNPAAIYSISNPYLVLAGLFDLNISTNIPIYKKFGHMGELQFVLWLTNLVYQAAQQGKITATDTALTVMNNIVQPAINAWGYGPMSDPHAAMITEIIIAMILQYTEGMQGNWVSVDGTYPPQFNAIVPFALRTATAAAPAAASTGVSTVTCFPVSPAHPQPVSMPRPATGTFANGASITPSSGSYIGDGAGEWYFGTTGSDSNGYPIYLYTDQPYFNGGYGVLAKVVNGQIYVQNAQGAWYTENGIGWLPVSVPPAVSGGCAPAAAAVPQKPAAPTVIASTDGSQITAPGTAFETAAGTLVYLGAQAAGDPNNSYGYPVWENGTQNGYLAGLLLLNGGQIYGVTAQGGWFQWTANNWVKLSGAPTVTTAATTSQVASQQATQACTPATTSGGCTATVPVTNATTGAVVGTTTGGDAITDSDIQSLINQMSAQNATAQQTYDAVIQSLEASGASVTTGLQNQVAAQVQASVPATTAATTSSSTGIYLVGGALAILGMLYFMGHRRA